ncbi:PilN domain-containing protein [Bradyrhizobium cenepequi]|uniref:PilN domain-containing protein n=1 Tax=Bradyrhizobium cenepequi TaxID=2821403 RepID=UPI001CE38266|nr:PilN domain-containing protein [Bradyrhizobium cenepequi]MCA6110013.1 PilN domain-containing protein [Bradyrhizobium cenepequi]
MTMIVQTRQWFEQWIAAVSGAVDSITDRLVRQRRIQLDENADGTFTASMKASKDSRAPTVLSFRMRHGTPEPPLPAQWSAAFKGSRVEVQLPPDHVMTRLLDFPRQAADFLDGMIRSQVDRLTPWGAGEAVFGWSSPAPIADDRIEVAFSATSASQVDPLVQLAERLGAASVAIHAPAAGGGALVQVKLLDKRLRSVAGPNVPRSLRVALILTGVAAAASLFLSIYLGGSLQSEQEDVQRQILQRRAALRVDANGVASGIGLLAKRKQTTPSSVMVLEALSHVLPDTTYVTELRIEGDKVQVVGMTQDAPSLIRLMEQSPQFTRATFFAPTTRAANESGERFHVEANISAYFGSGS